MSIAVLNQVYGEVRRLSIAGSNLAAGDFRLKKLIEPLQKSAQKAPVFGKVAEAIEKVVASTPNNSAESLLELTTLTTAILYTQGETGLEGKLTKIQSQELSLSVPNTSARIIKPLIEALTSVGSGRLEIIREAHERGAFKDLRLIKHAIGAIDDKYGEIADYVAEKVLPIYGKAIYFEVREGFDPKGKGDDARRLKLLHRLDPEATKSLVDEALESSSKEVKLEAINCLKGRVDAVDFLLQQVRAKVKDVRSSALTSLAPIDEPEVIEVLMQAVSGPDVELVADAVAANKNKQLQQHIVEEAKRQLDALLDPAKSKPSSTKKSAGKGKSGDNKTALLRLFQLLPALRGRADKAAVDFLLNSFNRASEVASLEAGYVDGNAVNCRVAELMLLSGSKQALAKLVETKLDVHPDLLRYGFLATCQTQSPAKVYEAYRQAYANRPEGKSKTDKATREVSEAIGNILEVVGSTRRWGQYWHGNYYDHASMVALYREIELDPRWLDEAIKVDHLTFVLDVADKPHEGTWTYLTGYVKAELGKKIWNPSYVLDGIVSAMIRTEHPEVVNSVLRILDRTNKSNTNWYMSYYMSRLISGLPEKAIEPLEAMLPEINEKLIDQFVSALDELKQQHKQK